MLKLNHFSAIQYFATFSIIFFCSCERNETRILEDEVTMHFDLTLDLPNKMVGNSFYKTYEYNVSGSTVTNDFILDLEPADFLYEAELSILERDGTTWRKYQTSYFTYEGLKSAIESRELPARRTFRINVKAYYMFRMMPEEVDSFEKTCDFNYPLIHTVEVENSFAFENQNRIDTTVIIGRHDFCQYDTIQFGIQHIGHVLTLGSRFDTVSPDAVKLEWLINGKPMVGSLEIDNSNNTGVNGVFAIEIIGDNGSVIFNANLNDIGAEPLVGFVGYMTYKFQFTSFSGADTTIAERIFQHNDLDSAFIYSLHAKIPKVILDNDGEIVEIQY